MAAVAGGPRKKRLDQLLVERGFADTVSSAERLVLAGQVLVSEIVADKPGLLYPVDATIRVKKRLPYVSRGGLKLAHGLDHFSLDPSGWTCIDIGASTGGFTDCLLQRGAARVFAVDVGYGQLDWKLRQDTRVVVLERTNVRALTVELIDVPVDLAVFDASFTSLKKIIPPVLPFFAEQVRIVALIKPQFELQPDKVGSGGIVTSEDYRLEAIGMIESCAAGWDLVSDGVVESPITGSKGNREYLIFLRRP